MPYPESYVFEGKITGSSRLSAGPVLADELSTILAGEKRYVYGQPGETIPLRLTPVPGQYDEQGRYLFAGQLNCEADFPRLSLSSSLKTVEAEAFRGDIRLRCVILPEGTTTIGSGAFADCSGLWMVLVPGSVTSIAPDAFDRNNPHLTLLVLQDSPAHVYAEDHGIKFQIIPE